MMFAFIACGVIIVALLAVIIGLQNDRKFITEMYHSLKSDHNRVLDKWKEAIDKWETALEYCDESTVLNKEIIELNRELRNDISDFEQRITLLEKINGLHVISDNNVQKICPVTKAPCVVEEEKQ